MSSLLVVNSHMHLFPLNHVPDALVKVMVGGVLNEALDHFGLTSRHTGEGFLAEIDNNRVMSHKGRLTDICKGIGHFCDFGDNAEEFFEAFGSNLAEVSEQYLGIMDETGIDIAFPLLMDLTCSVSTDPWDVEYGEEGTGLFGPKTPEGMMPFDQMIDEFVDLMGANPWKLFPFVMFDPRRPDAFDLISKAISQGMCGIKMYTPLGYSPDPADYELGIAESLKQGRFACYYPDLDGTDESNFFEMEKRNQEVTKVNLERVYAEFGRDFPITAHCGTGGIYSNGMWDRCPVAGRMDDEILQFIDPLRWVGPVEKYGLRVNLGHFGGGEYATEGKDVELMWREEVIGLMRTEFSGGRGKFYTDVSYHSSAIVPRKKVPDMDGFFYDLGELLLDPVVGKRIMFGSDFPMYAHSYSEDLYVDTYRNGTEGMPNQEEFFSKNALEFLFGGGTIPKEYVQALADASEDGNVLVPDWVE